MLPLGLLALALGVLEAVLIFVRRWVQSNAVLGLETRPAPRPLRAAAGAADELPHPVAVGPAAVAGHDRPLRDPPLQRLRPALPRRQHPAGPRRHDRPADDVLAARSRRRRDGRADRLALDALREGVRRRVAPRPGPAGRPRDPGGGGRGRHPGDQVVRPQRPRGTALRRGSARAAGDQPRQGPAVGAVLDLPRGHPQPRRRRRAPARGHRRRPGRPDARRARRVHHPAALARVAGLVARRHPRHGAGGHDRGRAGPRDLRHRARHRRRRPAGRAPAWPPALRARRLRLPRRPRPAGAA